MFKPDLRRKKNTLWVKYSIQNDDSTTCQFFHPILLAIFYNTRSPRVSGAHCPVPPRDAQLHTIHLWLAASTKEDEVRHRGQWTRRNDLVVISEVFTTMDGGKAGKRKNNDPPWKFNSSPLKMTLPKRKVVFQPSFFRGYVKLRGCTFVLSSWNWQVGPYCIYLYHISGQHSVHYHGHFFHDSSKVKNRPPYNPL